MTKATFTRPGLFRTQVRLVEFSLIFKLFFNLFFFLPRSQLLLSFKYGSICFLDAIIYLLCHRLLQVLNKCLQISNLLITLLDAVFQILFGFKESVLFQFTLSQCKEIAFVCFKGHIFIKFADYLFVTFMINSELVDLYLEIIY